MKGKIQGTDGFRKDKISGWWYHGSHLPGSEGGKRRSRVERKQNAVWYFGNLDPGFSASRFSMRCT